MSSTLIAADGHGLPEALEMPAMGHSVPAAPELKFMGPGASRIAGRDARANKAQIDRCGPSDLAASWTKTQLA